jgi:hypothetical protein
MDTRRSTVAMSRPKELSPEVTVHNFLHPGLGLLPTQARPQHEVLHSRARDKPESQRSRIFALAKAQAFILEQKLPPQDDAVGADEDF